MFHAACFQIIVMDEGKITHEGNLEEIKTKDPELYQNWKETTQRIRYYMCIIACHQMFAI